MKCTNCGATLAANATVCDVCGTVVTQQSQQSSYAQPTPSTYSNQGQTPAPQPYQQGYQQGYQQPTYNNAYQNQGASYGTDTAMSVGDWLITFIITAIPIIGIIMIFVWAFGSGGNLNRRNYARAALIMALIGLVIGILFTAVWGTLFATIFNNLDYYSVVNFLPF